MEPFKNVYSPKLVELIATHLERHLPGLDREGFIAPIVAQLGALEFKARAQLVADAMHSALPHDPTRRANILLSMLHPEPSAGFVTESDDRGLGGWAVLPLSLVVAQHGAADVDRSLTLLREMTMRFSSEFGVRYLLDADQDRVLAKMSGWVRDPDPHVRRLVSEGTRPRLPWAMRLQSLIKDPAPVLPLLAALRDDPVDFVRKSVANHLNDISKDNPLTFRSILLDWMVDANPNRRAMLRHAARGMIKAGDDEMLRAFGFGPAQISPSTLELATESVRIGDKLGFSVNLRSTGPKRQNIAIDYVIHFRKSDGKLAPKVFKGGIFALDPGETLEFQRFHDFRQVTIRRYYPGQHAISLRINGADTDAVSFQLLPQSQKS